MVALATSVAFFCARSMVNASLTTENVNVATSGRANTSPSPEIVTVFETGTPPPINWYPRMSESVCIPRNVARNTTEAPIPHLIRGVCRTIRVSSFIYDCCYFNKLTLSYHKQALVSRGLKLQYRKGRSIIELLCILLALQEPLAQVREPS